MSDWLFLDTSGLLCLFDTGNNQHKDAGKHFKNAKSLITTNYILAEFVPLTHARRLKRANALNFLKTLILLPRIELIWVDEDLHNRAMRLLDSRLDKNYSLCDAVSFIVMRERGIATALTTDKHFEQENFVKLLES